MAATHGARGSQHLHQKEKKKLIVSMRALAGLLTSWAEVTPEKSVLTVGWGGQVSGKITRASTVKKGNKALKNNTLRSVEVGCGQKDGRL